MEVCEFRGDYTFKSTFEHVDGKLVQVGPTIMERVHTLSLQERHNQLLRNYRVMFDSITRLKVYNTSVAEKCMELQEENFILKARLGDLTNK